MVCDSCVRLNGRRLPPDEPSTGPTTSKPAASHDIALQVTDMFDLLKKRMPDTPSASRCVPRGNFSDRPDIAAQSARF
jgi:hypothetical protein